MKNSSICTVCKKDFSNNLDFLTVANYEEILNFPHKKIEPEMICEDCLKKSNEALFNVLIKL